MGIGDWGLGIGDWGLGPIPNPPIPYGDFFFFKLMKININKIYYKYYYLNYLKSLFIKGFSN